MKRIKRFIFTFIVLFLIFPCLINAATELSASTQNPILGENLYIQLEANYGSKINIRDFHAYIDYDPEYFEVTEIKWIKSRTQLGTHRIEDGKIYIDKDGGNWSSGPILQVVFVVKKTGSSKIDIVATQPAYYTDGSTIAQTTAGIVINAVEPNTNVDLSTMYIKNFTMQPAFKKSTSIYNLTVPSDTEEIEIVMKKGDTTQTVTGYGTKKLKYGLNKFKVTVTAQNKASKTYEINVTRSDDRTGDLTLKYLSVTNTSIKIEDGKTDYEATVGRSTESVLINARTNDEMATLIGTGQKELAIGENNFELLVQSANGLVQTYKIKIIRSTEELEEQVQSSKLKAIKVNNLLVKVTEDKNNYLYGINKDINELNIEPVLVSPTATYEITGHNNLKDGINKINIKVTEVLQEAIPETENTPAQEAVKEETEYNLIVYKNPSNAVEINSFDQITGDNDYIYITMEEDSHIISKDIVEKLVNNKKTLYFNIVNMYTGLLYQVKLPQDMEIKDYDLKLNKISSGDITYSTNLPKDTLLTIYVGDQFQEGTGVQLYSYNDGEGYNLITAGVEVMDGYIKLETNGHKNYIITTSDLIPVEDNTSNIFNIIITIIVVVIIGALAAVVITKITKKKNKVEENNEPLY